MEDAPPYDLRETHLIEQNIFIINVHNAVLQCAFPPAFGPRHLYKFKIKKEKE